MAAGEGLREYLDATWPDRAVLVPGDWNDDVDESITSGRDTPYRSFVDAAPEWVFPTASLSAAEGAVDAALHRGDRPHPGIGRGDGRGMRRDRRWCTEVDEFIDGYLDTTSDHLPVLARFAPGG